LINFVDRSQRANHYARPPTDLYSVVIVVISIDTCTASAYVHMLVSSDCCLCLDIDVAAGARPWHILCLQTMHSSAFCARVCRQSMTDRCFLFTVIWC